MTSSTEIPFRRQALLDRGFTGFTRFAGIDPSVIPDQAGVYVVLRERDTAPSFLERSPAGWFKGRDPTVPVAELAASWIPGAHCVYIGKAAATNKKRHLRKRIIEFRRFGDGQPIGHQGGKRIWQLADADDYVIGWRVVADRDPEEVETELIASFIATHGRMPIGNRKRGKGSR